MKAEELMIGDWARVNHDGLCIKKGTIVVIGGIDADNSLAKRGLIGSAHCRPLDDDQFEGGIWCEYLEPIPLTTEILKKNGFTNLTGHTWWYKDFHISLSDTQDLTLVCGRTIQFSFVHELQHALRLCRIEKEITI